MRLRLLVLALLLPLELSAQARDSIISVSSTRTSRIAPDRASFYLIVEGTAETTADALARVESKLKAVTDALKTFGPRVTLDPPVAYGVGPTPPNGYPPPPLSVATNVARSIVRVQLTRPEQLAHVIAAAITAGATGSSSLTFEATAADSVRRARIGDALTAARLDAEALASSLGAHLGALVSVNASAPLGFQSPITLNFDNRFGQPSQAPDIVINANVTVQYRIVR